MEISREIYNMIVTQCPDAPPETGGVIGGKNGVITVFEFDIFDGNGFSNSYRPNVKFLNKVIQKWITDGISFMGVFHSHEPSNVELSMPDRGYIIRIMEEMPTEINELYFPIVFPKESMQGYIALRKKDAIEIEYDMITLIDK